MPVYDRNKLREHAVRSASDVLKNVIYDAEGQEREYQPDPENIVSFSLTHIEQYMKEFDETYDSLHSMGFDADHNLIQAHNAAGRAVASTIRILDKGAPDVNVHNPG